MKPTGLRDHLARSGPVRAGDLRRAHALPATTFQRLVGGLGAELLVTGRARARTYALRREVAGLRTPVPVYEASPDGDTRLALTLHPVAPFGFWVEPHVPDVDAGFLGTGTTFEGPDLPWFLDATRLDGYLGRAWLRAHPEAGFPSDLHRWTGDDFLRFAAYHEPDLPGAWLVGPAARDRWRTEDRWSRAFPPSELAARLPDVAEQVTRAAWGGSSPGGDQPKFTVRTIDAGSASSWIVKFTAPIDDRVGRRWADLLVAEHIAHEVLRTAGVDAAHSHVLDAGGRRFLLVERFDRHGAFGRSGVVSLHPLDPSGAAHDLRRWSLATAQLASDGRLAPTDHARVRWLEAFGHLVANTDMHPGNLSLRLRGTRILGLAPVYDMLPMAHAPRPTGEVRAEVYDPLTALDAAPATARDAARAFWERVAAHPLTSPGYAELAVQQHRRAIAVPAV